MSVRAFFNRVSVAVVVGMALVQMVPAQSVTRAEALQIGESYVNHRWTAGSKNVRHGKDAAGIQLHTPDRASGHGNPATDCWVIGDDNTGVAYKWGGFDTPERFSAGVKAGKAAGDIYNAEKRRLGGAAVSGEATGVDCSGFVSRCWKLSSKHSTSMLAGICQKLDSPASLKPADVMNTAAGHVLLFVRWLDAGKKRALFYEAAPYSKTRSTERDVAELAAAGFVPLRYRRIKD